MDTEAQKIVVQLDLQPHPEGGFFKETFRSEGTISNKELGKLFHGDRNFSTAIYFLLTSENFSAFHRIKQDETWHFYKGNCLNLHIISPSGEYRRIKIGNKLDRGEIPQFTVKSGDWFAAEIPGENNYTLVGCTVAPGFDFRDFEMPKRELLLNLFPQHVEIISSLTRA